MAKFKQVEQTFLFRKLVGFWGDQTRKWSGTGLLPPLSQTTAMQPQYPRLSPIAPVPRRSRMELFDGT